MMMLDLYFTARFKRDYKQMLKRGANAQRLSDTVELLRTRQPLPPERRDHVLSGDYEGFRECHIQPDWLLVYQVEEDRLILTLFRTGTHSDLFRLTQIDDTASGTPEEEAGGHHESPT